MALRKIIKQRKSEGTVNVLTKKVGKYLKQSALSSITLIGMSETSETLLNYYLEVFTWEALTLGSYRKALKTR